MRKLSQKHLRWMKRAAIAAALSVAALAGLRTYLYKKAPCASDCSVFEGGTLLKHEPRFRSTYKPACDPLHLKLELHKSEGRLDRTYSLWYRATLTNRCCERLDLDAINFLLGFSVESNAERGSGLYFRVWDPDGVEVIPGYFSLSTDYYPVLPYRIENKPNPTLAGVYRGDNYFPVTLEPGASIVTNQSILSPTCVMDPNTRSYLDELFVEGSLKTKEYARQIEAVERTFCRKAMDRMKLSPPEEPPEGFRTLDAFRFRKPGRYRIQAVYYENLVTADSIYPRAEALPGLLADLLWLLSELLPARVSPGGWEDSRYLQVKAESDIVEFTVRP